MARQFWRYLSVLILSLFWASNGQSQIIASFERFSSDDETEVVAEARAPEIAEDPLGEESEVYVDRGYVFRDVPDYLVGLEYLMLANEDKSNADFQLELTLSQNATVYLLLDNRIGDDEGTNPAYLEEGAMEWILEMGFTTHYDQIGIDEKLNDNQEVATGWFTIYQLNTTAGSLMFEKQDEGDSRRLYSIVVEPYNLHPEPADGEDDVSLRQPLVWQAGIEGATYELYFGTDVNVVTVATASDSSGLLFYEALEVNTFDVAGWLDYDQTYYWRVDCVLAGVEVTPGQVWSFAAERTALALESGMITASASHSLAGSGPEKTIDGSGLDDEEGHSINRLDMWQTTQVIGEAVWIAYEFDKVYELTEMQVWNSNTDQEYRAGIGIKDVTIEISLDGLAWTALGDYVFEQGTSEPNYKANTTIDFGGQLAQHVRLNVNSGYGVYPFYGLSEVCFWYSPNWARRPDPSTGSTHVSTDRTLSWRAGRQAHSYEVYIGQDETAIENRTEVGVSVSTCDYEVMELDLDTTYYWAVDAVNDVNPIPFWLGDLWNFTTCDSILIDDFEQYSDDEEAEEAVWQTWADGYGINENGAQVGYSLPPYDEYTIVLQGRKSMPYEYDNEGKANWSEATVEFETNQNWTARGVTSLVLSFYGETDNTPGDLYVLINDTKIPYDGASSDLSQALWLQWEVDLSQAASELPAVSSLTLGVDNGGEGQLFFDDIRLYAEAPFKPGVNEWFEAESAETMTMPMRAYQDPNASGGEYIATLGDSSNTPPLEDEGGYAVYTLRLDAGTYRIEGLVMAPTGNEDSFWVRWQGSETDTENYWEDLDEDEDPGEGVLTEWIRWGLGVHSEWTVVPLQSLDNDENEDVTFTVEEDGIYALEIAYREGGAKLDALRITEAQ